MKLPFVLSAFALLSVCACAAAPARIASAEPASLEPVPAGHERVYCRDMLRANSNQIQLVCGTEDEWKLLNRRMAAASRSLVYRLQGSSYSGGEQ